MPRLFPSLIAADPLNLRDAIQSLEPFCDGFHLDVMDNHYVPNLAGSADTIKSIAHATKRILWVHLMIDKPEHFIKTLTMPAQSIITFHLEGNTDYKRIVKAIHDRKWLASITIKPSTPLESLFEPLASVDHVLIMGVNPGFSGQQLIPQTLERIDGLVAHMKESKIRIPVGIDGGVTKELLATLVKRAINDFVMGNSLFGTPDPVITCKQMSHYLKSL